jgi:peroxiredoxin Q/BCP
MSLEGKTAPDFTLPRDGGEEVTLSALRPGHVILYFYPRDDTSGCTKEAIGFTEALGEIEAMNATVLGVSRDSIAKHEKFRDKHSLKVALLADDDGKVCEAYDVWKEKKMYGRTSMGIERSTFLIDGDGKVVREWRKVRVPGHVEDVMEALRELAG